MLGGLLYRILENFIFTLVIEWAVAWYLGCTWKKDFRTIFVINLITNPAAVLCFNLIYIFIGRTTAWICLIMLEVLIWILEAVMIRAWMGKRGKEAVRFSLYINGVSVLAGIVITILRMILL